jgi:hypothetical protein
MTNFDVNLKNQLLDLAETLNAFKSEAVQIKIAERLLNNIFTDEDDEDEGQNVNYEGGGTSRRAKRINPNNRRQDGSHLRERKSTGATKAMYRLLESDFFNEPKTIAEIAYRYNEEFNESFKTSEISGILLKSVKENLLKREKNPENKRFEYVKVNAESK